MLYIYDLRVDNSIFDCMDIFYEIDYAPELINLILYIYLFITETYILHYTFFSIGE